MYTDHTVEFSDVQKQLEYLQLKKQQLELENQGLKDESDKLRVAFHKYSSRLAALEHALHFLLKNVGDSGFDLYTMTETKDILDETKMLLSETQTEIKYITGVKLPLTKVTIIDGLFSYYAQMCQSMEIDFQLNVSGDILQMIAQAIPRKTLEDIIGVHVQNAINAVMMSDNSFRCILVYIGMSVNSYAISVHDSGIPFVLETLTKLGTQRVTTHADTGGSGIGFMTTFESMEEYKASLIIHEKEPISAGFSKSVTIRFDGQHRYIIETYRPEAFPKSERYEIESRAY